MKIGLDVDDVLADFVPAYCKLYKLDMPTDWIFDRYFTERIENLKKNKLFWLNLKPKLMAHELKFIPDCYITSRNIPIEWTKLWLSQHDFPLSPIYCSLNKKKSGIAKELNLDMFVDDNYDNYVDLNNSGIDCYLLDCTHNQKYEVGNKRIDSLKDLNI